MTERSLLVTAAIAPLNAEPRASSEQISQRLFGHSVTVLEERGPWRRVRGEDGYAGWMHQGYLRAARSSDHDDRFSDWSVSLGCVALGRDGVRRTLPLGARIPLDFSVEQGESIRPDEMAKRFPRDADAVTQTAIRFFEGTPYEWGGITPMGADCSGLVQTCLGLHGLAMPRDARQQAELGSEAGSSLRELRPAELAFFSERDDLRITHVAIALGAHRLVHLAIGRGGFAVEDLDRGGDEYLSILVKRFVAARRVVEA